MKISCVVLLGVLLFPWACGATKAPEEDKVLQVNLVTLESILPEALFILKTLSEKDECSAEFEKHTGKILREEIYKNWSVVPIACMYNSVVDSFIMGVSRCGSGRVVGISDCAVAGGRGEVALTIIHEMAHVLTCNEGKITLNHNKIRKIELACIKGYNEWIDE